VKDERDGLWKRRIDKASGREITSDEWRRHEWQDRDLFYLKIREGNDG
jgi:hypothetical protein